MKKVFILLSSLFLTFAGLSQSCLPYGITFSTQSQIDSFQVNYPGCSVVEGNVIITGNEITSLAGLSQIIQINGNLDINDNDSLTNLTGLESLGTVRGHVTIFDNNFLNDISALGTLSGTIYNLVISNNNNLNSLNGLEGLTGIGFNLAVVNNNLLTSLDGLNGITTIGHSLTIENNDHLLTLSGLESVSVVASEITIYDNDSLQNLSALIGLKRVYHQLSIFNNDALTNLSGLDSLESIGVHLNIWDNDSLKSLAGLNHLKVITSELSIYNNDALVDLDPLESTTSIGNLEIDGNQKLKSIKGIDQIDPYSLFSITIINNDSLSICNVKCICEYIQTPDPWTYIENNAIGCNNVTEVETACIASSEESYEISHQSSVKIYPNPAYNQVILELISISSYDFSFSICNAIGWQVIRNRTTEPLTIVDISDLPQGMYFVRVSDEKTVRVGRFVKVGL
jgi:hypothetical protein